jgi:CCR4-NOT transcription complex subunit 6
MLEAAGYGALYKTKTREAVSATGKVDGCALFYRKSRVRLHSNAVLELNEAALIEHSENVLKLDAQLNARPPAISPAEYETRRAMLDSALKRLTRDNVAQFAVFHITHSPALVPLEKEQPLLVVNTHLFWDPQFADVKLWQAAKLLREIESAARDAGGNGGAQGSSALPLLLCGDLNSEPSSAVYKLLAGNAAASSGRRFELLASDLPPDPAGVLASLAGRARLSQSLLLQSLHAGVTSAEPLFTNLTRDYVGTLDYVWGDAHVRPLSAVEIPTAESLTGGTRHKGVRKAGLGGASFGGGAFSAESPAASTGSAGGFGVGGGGGGAHDEADGSDGLPNGQWPSDHIPLVFEVLLQGR